MSSGKGSRTMSSGKRSRTMSSGKRSCTMSERVVFSIASKEADSKERADFAKNLGDWSSMV